MNASKQSILEGGRAREQALLPFHVAVKICFRGIRTRLGRSMVTLSGVGLGIAFLMSVLVNFHIGQAMSKQAKILRDIERRVALTRATVGKLDGKKIVFLAVSPSKMDLGYLRRLNTKKAILRSVGEIKLNLDTLKTAQMPNDFTDAAVAILLGTPDVAAITPMVEALHGQRVLHFSSLPQATIDFLKNKKIPTKKLEVQLRPEELKRIAKRQQNARYRMVWIVAVSLLITISGISNAMLMSVTERFREIATMKCLGALSSFVVKLFLIESSFIGLVGSFCGMLIGVVFPILMHCRTYSLLLLLQSLSFQTLAIMALACTLAGMLLSVIAGIYPARVAAKMIPADALRTNV